MYIGENEEWMRYSSVGNWRLSTIKDCGKWMFYFNEQQFAIEIIAKALDSNIVKYAKHTKGNSGIACLYVSGSNLNDHQTLLKFMIANNLIRLTTDLNYFDTSFKFNAESWLKQYGTPFKSMISLSTFMNISTGQFYKHVSLTDSIRYQETITHKSDFITPLEATTKNFLKTKVNKILAHDQLSYDINDKLMYLIPIIYKVNNLFKQDEEQIMHLAANNIYHFYNDNKNHSKISKLKAIQSTSIDNLFNLLEQDISVFSSKIMSIYSSTFFDEQLLNTLAYLLYLSIFTNTKEDQEQV